MENKLWIHQQPEWVEYLIIFTLGHFPFMLALIFFLIGFLMNSLARIGLNLCLKQIKTNNKQKRKI
jgi:hypothetical protein